MINGWLRSLYNITATAPRPPGGLALPIDAAAGPISLYRPPSVGPRIYARIIRTYIHIFCDPPRRKTVQPRTAAKRFAVFIRTVIIL